MATLAFSFMFSKVPPWAITVLDCTSKMNPDGSAKTGEGCVVNEGGDVWHNPTPAWSSRFMVERRILAATESSSDIPDTQLADDLLLD